VRQSTALAICVQTNSGRFAAIVPTISPTQCEGFSSTFWGFPGLFLAREGDFRRASRVRFAPEPEACRIRSSRSNSHVFCNLQFCPDYLSACQLPQQGRATREDRHSASSCCLRSTATTPRELFQPTIRATASFPAWRARGCPGGMTVTVAPVPRMGLGSVVNWG
jgi:hypothetical protein